jgi:hypothetical protein
VGCQDDFAAALIGIFQTSSLPEAGALSPLRPWAALEGPLDEGPDWDLAAAGDGLLVGVPQAGEVRWWPALGGGDVDPDGPRGRLRSLQPRDRFGAHLLTVPDLDGDGVAELLVTAPAFDRGPTSRQNGAAFLFSGAGAGFTGELDTAAAAGSVVGRQDGAALGDAAAVCPDLDGDGAPELLLGAPDQHADPLLLAGAVFLATSAELRVAPQLRTDRLRGAWTGGATGARAGAALSCAHDLTGDGLPDPVVGAPFEDGAHEGEGAVYLIDGADVALPGPLADRARLRLSGPSRNAWLGAAVATGDLDGDGLADLAVGAPGYTRTRSGAVSGAGQGAVWVWDGVSLTTRDPPPRARLHGEAEGDAFGAEVQLMDLNADGLQDLLVGAPRKELDRDRGSAFEAGQLYAFPGAPGWSGWRTNEEADDAPLTWLAERQFLRTGWRVRSGDVDGDAAPELLLLNRTD